MADFISLADLKAALKISDGSQDADLSEANSTATGLIVDYLNRDPRATDYVERTDGRGGPVLLVNQYPINSVASVVIGGQPMTADQIDFDENTIFFRRGGIFPRGRRNVTVTYNAGENPLPRTIRQAAIYTVRALLTSRGVDLNSSGESWAGVSSQTWNPGGPGVVPLAAQTLLRGYQRTLSLP